MCCSVMYPSARSRTNRFFVATSGGITKQSWEPHGGDGRYEWYDGSVRRSHRAKPGAKKRESHLYFSTTDEAESGGKCGVSCWRDIIPPRTEGETTTQKRLGGPRRVLLSLVRISQEAQPSPSRSAISSVFHQTHFASIDKHVACALQSARGTKRSREISRLSLWLFLPIVATTLSLV